MFLYARCAAVLVMVLASLAQAQQTQTRMLSGIGKDDMVPWQFMCDKGQNAGEWSTIGVPSNWQLQGFGIYEYGQPKPAGGWPRVHGVYKRTFTTPANWKTKAVFLKFEGVMTDAQVTVNGQSAGPIHQGGYYAFKYNITDLLKPAGQQNELQVDVDDDSMNESVNRAERRADYWNYAGIFRPVYLEAEPKTFIDRVAINGRADGSLGVDVYPFDTREGTQRGGEFAIEGRVLDAKGQVVGKPMTAEAAGFDGASHLSEQVANPKLWSAEFPNLYELEVRLKMGGRVVHSVKQRFGFRTLEVRPGHGFFVNGQRVFMKGVARHSFWPDSGRTLSPEISKLDIETIKDMNGNAVRSSHYPPDRHFLDACDELGLYVLDELGGWHGHYDTEVGSKLVKEMVEHDVNHPSIVFWDNGNEGGINPDLDGEFAKYDPQHRTVLHPWTEYPLGIADTKHYPNFEQLKEKLALDPVFFPTEMLHGLYDGGQGAGLNEYWNEILKSKAGAGGFLWSFVDEDVKRVDKGGILDSAGNQAPDGIVGPYREREGSFDTVKTIWSPIIVTASDGAAGSFRVENRYAFTDADLCTYEWQAIAFAQPGGSGAGAVVLASRSDHGRPLAPGQSATWDGWGPPRAAGTKRPADAVRLLIKDRTGRLIQTYVWPTSELPMRLAKVRQGSSGGAVGVQESGDTLTATAGDLSVRISTSSGLLVSASRGGQVFSLGSGPRVLSMTPRLPPPSKKQQESIPPSPIPPILAKASTLTGLTHRMEGDDLMVMAKFSGPMVTIDYRLKPNGWLGIEYVYEVTGAQEYFGVGFDYPEARVHGVRYLGDGPSTVYQNRLAGGTLNVWDKAYNDTMVGDPDDLKPGEHFNYPVFKGFYEGVRWLQLRTGEGPITAMVEQSAGSPVYVQLFTPKSPPEKLLGQTGVPFRRRGSAFWMQSRRLGASLWGLARAARWGSRRRGEESTREGLSCTLGRCLLDHGSQRGRGYGLGEEAVADAADGEEVAGGGGVVFEVAAKADDEVVDGAGVGVFMHAPDFFEEVFAGDDLVGAVGEVAEEVGLHEGEVGGGAVGDAELEGVEVDFAGGEGVGVL